MHEESRETHVLDEDISNITSAIEHEGQSLGFTQVKSLRRLMKWEIEGLEQELNGKCTVTKNYYPNNLNWKDFYGYIPLPTVVYELEYPRYDTSLRCPQSYIVGTVSRFYFISNIYPPETEHTTNPSAQTDKTT